MVKAMDTANPLQATRRQPRQARSRLLVASIRQACRQILQEGDAEQLTARSIADRAGVTIGSFYQYYSNKEAVLLDVLLEDAPDEADRLAAETRYMGELRWQSLEGTLRELVRLTCQRHRRLLDQHGDIYQRYHREIRFDNLIQASVSRYVSIQSLQEWLQELLLHHLPGLSKELAGMRAFLIATALTDITARAVDDQPAWLSCELFQAELQRLLLNQAQGEPPADYPNNTKGNPTP